MTQRPLVLRAEGARPNRRGRWLGIFAVAFCFLWLFGLTEGLRAVDPDGRLPGWQESLLIVVAFVPIAVWYVSLVRPRVGRAVATIPRELALPRASMWDAPTLAEAVVEMRPDRYALRGGPWEPGLTEFALRGAGDPIGRPRVVMHSTMVAVGVVLFLVAFLLLVIMLDRLG